MGAVKRVKKSFAPSFGSGAPGGSVNNTQPYYDTSTNPFTPYIFTAGSWHVAQTEPLNATSIQSIAISAAMPTNGQLLKYNGTQYVPT